MTRFGYARYIPPPPPRPETLEINLPSANAPTNESHFPQTRLTAIWTCPVCDTAVPQRRQAGRRRVYCTSACRQRAYRLRCMTRQAHPMSAHRDPRPTRATTRDRVHAIREYADVSSGRRDSTGRGVTACGAFAHMSIDTPERFGHVRITSTEGLPSPYTCRRCQQLTGLVPPGDPDALQRWVATSRPRAA